MYIVEVIPIQKIPRSLPQYLSYVSSKQLPEYSLVDIEIRKRIVPAIIVHTEPLISKKAALKQADFSLKPIHRIRSQGPILPAWYFSYLTNLAAYYLLPPSYIVNAALSFLENTLSFERIPASLPPRNSLPKPKLFMGVFGDRAPHYIKAISSTLKKRQGVLVLAPDHDTLDRMAAWYKEETREAPLVIHAGITKKKIATLWEHVFKEEGVVVFATRKGVFFPPRNLGLIILEGEGESGHKSPETPRYHSREAALVLQKHTCADLFLGSSSPTLETFYKATQGEYDLIQKASRSSPKTASQSGPPPTVISLKEETDRGPLILSKTLEGAISKTLEKKKQVILFSYRLGATTVTVCRRCNHTFRCPSCDVSLVTKRTKRGLRFFCHYCGYETPVPDTCPECGSVDLTFRGTGSERVEAHLASRFPEARIARYDSDTIKTKRDEKAIREAFISKQCDILVGTQTMLGSIDLLRAETIAITLFDTLFHLPDFRSPERAFRIMRALERMRDPKSTTPLLIQTWQSDTEYLQHLASESFEAFAREEYVAREELSYPPFTHLVRIIYKHTKEDEARATIRKVADMFRLAREKRKFEQSGLVPIGPSAAFVPKIRNYYIMTLLLKIKDPLDQEEQRIFERIVPPEAIIDVNPIDML